MDKDYAHHSIDIFSSNNQSNFASVMMKPFYDNVTGYINYRNLILSPWFWSWMRLSCFKNPMKSRLDLQIRILQSSLTMKLHNIFPKRSWISHQDITLSFDAWSRIPYLQFTITIRHQKHPCIYVTKFIEVWESTILSICHKEFIRAWIVDRLNLAYEMAHKIGSIKHLSSCK